LLVQLTRYSSGIASLVFEWMLVVAFLCVIIASIFVGKAYFSKNSVANKINAEKARQLGISKRELEILQLIAQGMSNKQIADKLFLAEITIKKHTSNLFAKLNANRRTEAVHLAKDLELLA
ncbi:MAG: response regulator transcription factor, partial [Cyclobacteriaceae bacterium]